MTSTAKTYRSSSLWYCLPPVACLAACSGDDDPLVERRHDHDTPIEVAAENAPEIELSVYEDPMAGHNLHISLTNFELAPQHASTEHVEGEGHMHLYVDGQKLTRLYGEWFHLDGLDEGEREVRVELSANSHNPLALDGEIIDDSQTIEVEVSEHAHGALDPIEVEGDAAPSVSLQVIDDPISGWNVHAVSENFTITPGAASTDHVEGEGHMHLYVDGRKLARLYGEWFYVGAMPLGEIEVRVELSANSHHPLAHDGSIIDDSETIEVTEADSHTHDDGHGHEGQGGHAGGHATSAGEGGAHHE